MPVDYKKYPKNWSKEIRPDILSRAKNLCEFCGVQNYDIGYRDLNGVFYNAQKCLDLLESGYNIFEYELLHKADANKFKPIKIILTIAHLDHDITNNDYSNLKALCQKCHLNHDKEHHKKNMKATLRAKKQIIEMEF